MTSRPRRTLPTDESFKSNTRPRRWKARGTVLPGGRSRLSNHVVSLVWRRTILGLRVKDGVVLAVEKPVHSRLLKPHVNRRIHTVELHAGVVGAGLVADCRALANRAREECASHRETFERGIEGAMLAERLALYMQAYTLYGSVRPFCATMLVAAVDADGPHLYMMEPSGVCWVGRRRSARTPKTTH